MLQAIPEAWTRSAEWKRKHDKAEALKDEGNKLATNGGKYESKLKPGEARHEYPWQKAFDKYSEGINEHSRLAALWSNRRWDAEPTHPTSP